MTSEPDRRAIGSLRAVALDAPDIDRLATFYEQLAGWRRVPDDDHERITLDTGEGWRIGAHASLVAREYAIPAVVGTGDATQRLRPGQLVTVDGAAATVTPHDEPSSPQPPPP